jgi:hypothetical protein
MYKVIMNGVEMCNSNSFSLCWDYARTLRSEYKDAKVVVTGPEGEWEIK